MNKGNYFLLTLLTPLLFGCASASTSTPTPPPPADIASLLSNVERSPADAERDVTSKPAEILQFFDVRPGMRVADLFSGGGYYSELVSHAVGPTGRVIAHNNTPYARFAGDAPKARYKGERLRNLEYLVSEADDLQLPSDLDMILMVMSFHDTYWINEDQGWPKIDNRRFNEQMFASLKSGGTLAIVDHAASAGSGTQAVGDLHRIDKAFVISELRAVGFRLVDETNLLGNAADDHSKLVFDPSIRRKTDRFILRFEKR